MNRRSLLKNLAAFSGLATLAPLSKAASTCAAKTPQQTQGPFYPVQDQVDKDADLTQVKGSGKAAVGRIIYIQGRVSDLNCQPVADTYVEIWQACATGKYNHPGDPNPQPLDPNFQYWGIVRTDAKGEYKFKTIYPGAYPADETWMRPPHVHFKVHKWGYRETITQLYFEGEQYNEKDLILQQLSEPQQVLVVRPVDENNVVQFDITITKGR